jgi:ribosomal protein S18 acetylase RimI-like enzyme
MGIALKKINFNKVSEGKNSFVYIRKVSHKDLFDEKLLELTLKCFPELFKDISSVKDLRENRIKISEKIGDQFLNYVAYTKKNNTPAGFASMIIKKELPNIGYLSGAGTDVEYRKKGIYTSLLTGRIQEAKRIGLEYLITDAEEKTSAPILEKHGFSFIEKFEIYRYTF